MRRAIIAILAFFVIVGPSLSPATADPVLQFAPAQDTVHTSGGFVPPSVDLSHVTLPPFDPSKAGPLPARYDVRDLGIVTPVKNQGVCGACYAFAMAGDIEATVLRDYDALVDISENHLKECHFEGRSCDGGNAQMVANLSSADATRNETCDPYVASDTACNTGCDPYFSVLQWRWLMGDGAVDTEAIKQAIMDHGPISTSVYAGDESNTSWWTAFSNWNGGSGLYHVGSETNNHAVMLVGWDDDHPHDGGGTGCWIMRNSWGNGWGDSCDFAGESGYCYIAYGSAGIGEYSSVVTEVMPSYPELAVVGHDEAGWQASVGYGSTVAWAMVRIDATETTNLHRVEFWSNDAGSGVHVYVYDQFSGGTLSGLLDSRIDVNIPAAGYHSVDLGSPLSMVAGNDYYVVVRYNNDTGTFPVAVDNVGPFGSGQSWVSFTGSSWNDLSASSCDAGIRVRTSPHLVLPIEDDDPQTPPVVVQADEFRLHAPWPNPFNPATTVSFTLGEPTTVSLKVYDLQGRLVRTLSQGFLHAGQHHVRWNGRDHGDRAVAAGVYVCRLDDGWRQRTQRLVLVR